MCICVPSLPASPVHGISQARILESVAIPFSRGSSQPRARIHVSCISRWVLCLWATREAQLTTYSCCCWVTQSCPTLLPHRLKHARLFCPSPSPGVFSDSCPLNPWCHPTITSSVIPFSYFLQSFPASGSFPMSRFSASGGQSTGASASVLPRI